MLPSFATSGTNEISKQVYNNNLKLLKQHCPMAAAIIERTPEDRSVTVSMSRVGLPVPLINGTALYSLDDPIAEASALVQQQIRTFNQQRLLVYGFGFGYHLLPFIAAGLSPIVVEPSVEVFRQAMRNLNLGEILPYISLYLGERPPDLPRCTAIQYHPIIAELFPHKLQGICDIIVKEYPAKTDDIEEGIYYSTYRNIHCLKNPCDLAVYQMLLWLVRPTLILEIGALRGGSALWFADQLRIMGGERHIHSYDIHDHVAPEVYADPNITFHLGGWTSFDPAIVKDTDRVLVIEDSSHTYENTIQVLRTFAPYVTPNSYFIVEDGASGLVRPEFNGGAIRAIEEFLQENNNFDVDSRFENFYGSGISNCLKGFLRRKLDM